MKNPPPQLEFREYRPGEEQAILATFNRTFARIDPGFEPRSVDEWRWRFLQNPAGWRIWLAVSPDGEIAAQQAAIPIRVKHRGEEVTWLQVVDSFADPRLGRGLRKPGLFVQVALEFIERYGGPAPLAQLMYGMPVRPAYRIGQRFLSYQPLRNQVELRAKVKELSFGSAQGVVVEETSAFPEDVLRLSDRLAESYPAFAIRDRAYLEWRFCAHPTLRYRVASARSRASGELLGLAVFRACAFDGREAGRACDWLIAPGANEARAALGDWLCRCTEEAGQEELAFLLADTSAEFRALHALGLRVHPTSYLVTAGSYTARFHTLSMYRDWYYTMAEFDLC